MFLNRDKFNYLSLARADEATWEELTALGAVKTASEGSMLYEQSTEIHELTCLTEGAVKLVHFFDNGNEKLYEHLYAPAVIGYDALWSEGKSYYPTVIAMSDVSCSVIPLEEAECFLHRHTDMVISLFQCMRSSTCVSRIRNVCSMPMSAMQKAAFAIVFMRDAEKDNDGYVSVTHEELAHLIGISRANVTTALAELTDSGIIDKKRGRIKILDYKRLMELLDNPFCGADK